MKNGKFRILEDGRFRVGLLGALVVIGISVLTAKLYFEQIRRGDDYRERISRQSVRRIRVPARRGKVFSADLKVLADNTAGCAIVFYPEEMRRPGRRSRPRTIDYIFDAASAVAEALHRENPLTREEITRHLNTRPGLPIRVFGGLTPEEAAPALALTRQFDGIGLEADDARSYPCGKLAAHLIGYTGRENPRSAGDREDFFYYVPDLIGRAGLERTFDRPAPEVGRNVGVRGTPGFSLVQVDSQGFIRNNALASREPVDGQHLILTLDSRAQELAERALQGVRGALVLLDANTGAVLAMASALSPDLARYTPYLSQDYYSSLLNDPARPLLNRAINGTYTPGSILKPLVALAILRNGADPQRKIDCTGRAVIGTGGIRCAARYGHGELNLLEALERSCNVYFIEAGCEIGRAAIAEMLESAGIGRRAGLELADSRGVAPTVEYKRRYYRSGWNRFDTAQLSIGQGIILLTPLQAAVYTAALANGGKIMKPYLAASLVNQQGGILWERKPEVVGHLATTEADLAVVRQGMFQVVHAPEGSGKRADNPAITLYGKTGSAEVGSRENRWKNTWFIAFGTRGGRTYALAMVVEEGASGGTSCAPRVAEFFRQYLGDGKRDTVPAAIHP